jgi:hypothetical protein
MNLKFINKDLMPKWKQILTVMEDLTLLSSILRKKMLLTV